MTPPGTRRPQVPMAQRRAELTEAARRVMVREGAWTTTTRAVAAEAGVPHGSVHYAFSSKDELLKAVMAQDVESAATIFTPDVVAGGPGEGEPVTDWAEAVLRRAFSAYADRMIADPGTELVLQELTLMGARDPGLGAIVAESTASYRTMVAAFLAELAGRAGGTWDSPVEPVAEQVLGVCFGVASSWLVERDDDLLRRIMADAARATAARLTT